MPNAQYMDAVCLRLKQAGSFGKDDGIGSLRAWWLLPAALDVGSLSVKDDDLLKQTQFYI